MNILLLAGTHEARVLAQIIDNTPEYFLISSLAGVTKEPVKISRNMRFGGFGGVEGLKKFIHESNIQVVIDVTHPFARTISKNAESACNTLSIPYFLFERPEWVKLASDNWTEINDEISKIFAYVKRDSILGAGIINQLKPTESILRSTEVRSNLLTVIAKLQFNDNSDQSNQVELKEILKDNWF